MNIFYIDKDPVKAARMQCDKHVVKMALESAQILCTAHRVLDGKPYAQQNLGLGGRRTTHYRLDDTRENILYKTNFINHPCNVWCRESKQNYDWLYEHFKALCMEYKRRYDKEHTSWIKLGATLYWAPKKINNIGITPHALAFKDFYDTCLVEGDPVKSYQNYYISKMHKFKMVWTNAKIPEFLNEHRHLLTQA